MRREFSAGCAEFQVLRDQMGETSRGKLYIGIWR